MSQSTTLILLPQTAFNGTNNTITGSKFPAASYYLSKQNLQTVSWNVSTFTGTISVQGTLAEDPAVGDWFTVLNIVGSNTTQLTFSNVSGNFVWLRLIVTGFSTGTINYVKVSY
jgi:hypothetical protein